MMAELERRRPIKVFRWKAAYGPFRKGDTFQPVGLYRDQLLKRGLIEEVPPEPPPPEPELFEEQMFEDDPPPISSPARKRNTK